MPNTTSASELELVMLAIGRVERELENLTRRSESVGELFPYIRLLHDLQDRESELRGERRVIA